MAKSKIHLFICLSFILIAIILIGEGCDTPEYKRIEFLMTVTGPIHADSLGTTLIHEHVFLDWTGANSIDSASWDNDEAYHIILPYLLEAKEKGVKTIVECTPLYLGRNPRLLYRLSKASGIQILTNTGYYAARENKYIPAFAHQATVDELAERWIKEGDQGIKNSRSLPGFIKIGMDSKNQLTPMDEKLVRAAARTHLATGMTIVAHTGTDTTAAQELEILEEEGVAADAFVWTHAQRGTPEGHLRMAKKGAWISLDGMGYIQPDSATKDSSELYKYVSFLENLKHNQLLTKTLISHDAGWYTAGEKNQHSYKPYTLIFDLVIPVLKKRGFTQEDFQQLLIRNPKEAYSIKKRPI